MAKRIHTKLCGILNIEHPIILAGMATPFGDFEGNASGPELVAAVSNAGGLGLIGAGLHAEDLRDQIRRTKQLTRKPFGVDLLIPPNLPPTLSEAAQVLNVDPVRIEEVSRFVKMMSEEMELPDVSEGRITFAEEEIGSQLNVVFEEKVSVLATGLGTPAWVISETHSHGMKHISLVGNVRNAHQAAKDGVDVVVAQGYEAGGHTGRVATLVLVPQVVDVVSPTPVVAAGGIGDGRGLAAALALGAQGVLCGTVFLATYEAMIPEFIKLRIIKSNEEDTRISRIYTGKRARVMKNMLVEIWEKSGTPTLPMPLQSMINNKLLKGLKKSNNLEYLTSFAGQVIGMIKKLRRADDIVLGMVDEAVRLINSRLPEMVVS